ncbi:type II toxin-antitoxin system HicB family antitoxin [Acetobacteraceae bacterium ESL0709]|nr:type II toxin-antitoxin system HicB family antitoxin [Acetobacteraceae bacterium ESL0697]MDF7677369.1 type II toxin-antitoxin system HicB family antitoxin [Acetobacteraceae bacterium ESL0709]
MKPYLAFIRKDHDSDFGIEFPDFPRCISAGSTMEELLAMGSEALGAHIVMMRDLGRVIPEPSSYEAVSTLEEAKDAVITLIVPKPPARESVRISIMMDKAVLDSIAKVSGNRSRFLEDAARAQLAQL